MEIKFDNCERCQKSLENSSIAIAICGHKFHFKCLHNQVKYVNKCPECDKSIKREDESDSDDSDYDDHRADLHRYIRNGNLKKVIGVTEVWEPDNDDNQETYEICYAIEEGHFKVAKYLIDTYPSIFQYGDDFIRSAVTNGSINMIAYLLDRYDCKADYDDMLEIAVDKNHPHVIQYMLDMNLITVIDLITPLTCAIKNMNDEMIHFLISQKSACIEICGTKVPNCGVLDVIRIHNIIENKKYNPDIFKGPNMDYAAILELIGKDSSNLRLVNAIKSIKAGNIQELKKWITSETHLQMHGKEIAKHVVNKDDVSIMKYLIEIGLKNTNYFDRGLLLYAVKVRAMNPDKVKMVPFLVKNNAYIYTGSTNKSTQEKNKETQEYLCKTMNDQDTQWKTADSDDSQESDSEDY